MQKYAYGEGENIFIKKNLNSLIKDLLVQIQLLQKKMNITIHKKPPVAIVVIIKTVAPALPSTSLLFLLLTLHLPLWISRLMMSVPGTYSKPLASQVQVQCWQLCPPYSIIDLETLSHLVIHL